MYLYTLCFLLYESQKDSPTAKRSDLTTSRCLTSEESHWGTCTMASPRRPESSSGEISADRIERLIAA